MRKTRQVKAGNVTIGGGYPVSIQSMTNTDTRNVEATLAQIQALADEDAWSGFRHTTGTARRQCR